MVALEIMKTRNNNARLLVQSSRIHRNCFRINMHNTKMHEAMKFTEFIRRRYVLHEVVCEAEFECDGSKKCKHRADLFDLDTGEVVEVLANRKREDVQQAKQYFENKGLKYIIVEVPC